MGYDAGIGREKSCGPTHVHCTAPTLAEEVHANRFQHSNAASISLALDF